MSTEVWHRIEHVCYAPPVDEFDRSVGEGTVGLIHLTYPVVKTTAKGVWLNVSFFDDGGARKFVRHDAKRQFASPTFEQAKDKYRHRKQRQIEILKYQIRDIEKALAQLDGFKPNKP